MNKELAAQIDRYLASHRHELVQDLISLAEIPSISTEIPGAHPFGDPCAEVLDRALALAERYGLHGSNHGYYYGLADWGEGAHTIGIFSHLDVVPEGSGWQYPPYQPTELEGGWLVGRGVCDNKSGVIAGLYTLRCLQALGLPFQSKLQLFMGCNEECGMVDVLRYVTEQPMPDFSIVPDTAFPVCHGEKGILTVDLRYQKPFGQIKSFCGGVASNVVPDRAEAHLAMYGDLVEGLAALAAITEGVTVTEEGDQIVVRAQGVSAHASMPAGSVNAIGRLAAFLSEARGVADSDRAIMSVVADCLSDSDGAAIGIACNDQPSGALTCIAGLASMQEGCLCLNFNIRYPVTEDGTRLRELLRTYFAKHGWELTACRDSAPAFVPADDPKVTMICNIYRDITGKDATPYVMGGGTYARKLKNAIGFGPETDRPLPFTDGRGAVHQPDEVVQIDDLLEGIKIYVLSLLEVDKELNKA